MHVETLTHEDVRQAVRDVVRASRRLTADLLAYPDDILRHTSYRILDAGRAPLFRASPESVHASEVSQKEDSLIAAVRKVRKALADLESVYREENR